jgi:hypothetical protein
MISGLWALLTVIALALALVVAFIATVYVKRLEDRPTMPISEEIGSTKTVIRKLRKRQPMSADEVQYARQVVMDRGSLRTLCIPGALFLLSCYYVFGSLEYLHGATPSERTFLGVIPMLTSTNLGIQILRHIRLRGRLRNMA